MSNLAVLVPVLARPHRVKPLLDSLRAATFVFCRLVFICDPDDDAEVATVREVMTDGCERSDALAVEMLEHAGNYAAKIRAGVDATTEPLIFTGADDLDFKPGWLGAAVAKLTGPIGVVGVQDRCNRRTIAGEHATHFLMTRAYAETPTIDGKPGPFHQGYKHNFCDDELVATAKHRGAWAFANDAVVEHLHPMIGTAPDDDVYRKGREHFRRDRRLFNARSRLWT